MAVTVEISTLSAEGLVTVGGGTLRSGKGESFKPGTYITAQGRLVLAEDGKTVEFVPADAKRLADVIAADENA